MEYQGFLLLKVYSL